MNNHVIETRELSKKFANVLAVDRLSLNVPRCSVFAYLGPNGAGKTTTIKMLMNMIEPSGGSSTVLGVDSKKLGRREFERIGSVSENQKMPQWMTVEEFLAYCQPLYPTWDNAFCQKLRKDFDLPMKQKIKHLSRGMKMKTALLSSLAYRPELLVLDEPFTGLDPLVRDEFIEGVLELGKSEQWTIFISSHDIYEVERLADWVGMLDKGRLRLVEKIESLQARFRKIQVIMASGADLTPLTPADQNKLPGHWVGQQQEGSVLTFFDTNYQEGETEKRINHHFSGGKQIETLEMSLRDIFIVLAKEYKIPQQEVSS